MTSRADSVRSYRALQRHLDRQPVGFPATPSGADIRVLEHIFTPREADLACCLTDVHEPLATVFDRARHLVATPEQLRAELAGIHAKGGIEAIERDGTPWYRNTPLVVGFYEMQLARLTPQFITDVGEYLSDARFGLSFLSTALPQMRTIPIRKSIPVHHHVSTFDEATALLRAAAEPFIVVPCICRKKHAMQGQPCRVTTREETCLGMGRMAESFLGSGQGRRITRDEALAIVEQNQDDGLVLQPSNSRAPEFLCSCCACCCGMLDVHRQLPIPVEFWSSNYYAEVDTSACVGCGICRQRCQAGAIKGGRNSGKEVSNTIAIDRTRCLGCGLCVPTCLKKALSLAKKSVETQPPATRDELLAILRRDKRGPLGKLKVLGRLLAGMVKTGRFQLLK